METPTENQPSPKQTLLGAALLRSRFCRGVAVIALQAHGEAIVELLADIAATLRELPLAAEGKQNYEDATRYRLLKEHWPKEWTLSVNSTNRVRVFSFHGAQTPGTILAEGATLDEVLDALMPRM